jgi:hypothetical protein
MASHALHVGSAGYGFMTAAMGAGAVGGGLVVATRGKVGALPLILAAFGFGIAMTLAAIAPNLALELVALGLAGGAGVAFMSQTNATLQLRSDSRAAETVRLERSGRDGRRLDRHDPPRLVSLACDGQRPALREANGPDRTAGQNPGCVAVLDIAPTAKINIDRHRRRICAGIERDDADALHLRAPHDYARVATGVARMKQFLDRVGGGDLAQFVVGAVDSLGPGGHSAPRRNLEDVWSEARVRKAQVQCRGARVAAELQVREFRDLEARRRAVRDRALDQRLVTHRLVVGPVGLDDLVLERVIALGTRLD